MNVAQERAILEEAIERVVKERNKENNDKSVIVTDWIVGYGTVQLLTEGDSTRRGQTTNYINSDSHPNTLLGLASWIVEFMKARTFRF